MAGQGVLKIATFPNSWSITNCGVTDLNPRVGCEFTGKYAQILLSILLHLRLSYKLVPHEGSDLGTFSNGSWSEGLFAELENGTVDLIANLWFETELRKRSFGFTQAVTDNALVFITKSAEPNLNEGMWLLTQVFGLWVWVWLIVLLIFLILIIVWQRKYEWKMSKISYRQTDSSTVKVLLGVLGYTLVLFVNLYQAGLLACLLHPPTSPLIQNEDHLVKLIKEGQLTMVISYPDDFRIQSINHSQLPFFRNLRTALIQNPPILERNFTKLVSMLESGMYVYPEYSSDIIAVKERSCKVDVLSFGAQLPTYKQSFMFRKHSPYIALFDRAILELRQLAENIIRKYDGYFETAANENCAQIEKRHAGQPLKLISLFGAFIILLGLSLISVISFICEKFQQKAENENNIEDNENDKQTWVLEGAESNALITPCNNCIAKIGHNERIKLCSQCCVEIVFNTTGYCTRGLRSSLTI